MPMYYDTGFYLYYYATYVFGAVGGAFKRPQLLFDAPVGVRCGEEVGARVDGAGAGDVVEAELALLHDAAESFIVRCMVSYYVRVFFVEGMFTWSAYVGYAS